MKFTLSSTKLLQQMQALARVIASKNSLNILECVLFNLEGNQLILTASDGETTMRTQIEVEQAEGQGKIAFQAKMLLDTLKEFPELPLTFDINDQTFGLNIQSSNGTYNLVGINGAEYPEMVQELENARSFNFAAEALLNALNKTVFCTADDELRPVMNGVFFDIATDKITLVATDAHRLVRYINTTISLPEPASFILPKKPANLLRSILGKEQEDVKINFTDKNVRFEFGQTIVICRQIEGRFPNYNAVIPQNNRNKVTVDRQTILTTVRRVSVFANPGTGLIKLELGDNKINISAQDIDFSTSADETIECSYEGEPMSIGFKAPFLMEILATLQSDNVIFEIENPNRAGLILPFDNEANEDLVMLLMPMLLND
ncbi:MAG: DNA polymerase III subunit beta [Paludibacteraceae bacterium]|nr:DNA polymerase III subunit beta [Paludibacteraceae bacterium]